MALLLAWCFSALFTATYACSPPFSEDNSSVCAFKSSAEDLKSSWCGAQRYCSGIGGELIRDASNLQLLVNAAPNDAPNYWIGATDFQQECNGVKTCYRWTNGQRLPKTLPWYRDDPTDELEDCLLLRKQKELADVPCEQKNHFICQPRRSTSGGQHHFKLSSPLFASDKPDEYANGACVRVVRAESKLSCALACVQAKERACAAFYFHKHRSECIFLLHADARYQLGDVKGWRKFVMQK